MTNARSELRPDEDAMLGAVEDDTTSRAKVRSQVSTDGQLGHRDQDAMLKDNDSGMPEPDASGEHTGQR